MSSKAAKRRKEFEQREAKRKAETVRVMRMKKATNIEELANALGVKLK